MITAYSRLFSYYDWTYFLIIIGFIITLAAQMKMKSTVSRYKSVPAASGATGAQTARALLDSAGLYDIQIQQIPGELTDHYDPSSKVVRLSQTSCARSSIAAIGVAAHECGHAMQDAEGYGPLKFRSALVPAANIGSKLAWPVLIIGFIFSFPPLVHAGIILFSIIVVFHLVTLPMELNASSRALKMISDQGLLEAEEQKGAKAVLTAAALTYVAALASTLLTFIRLILLSGGGRRD